ncbi:MAG TPA: hypothetical protein VG476_06880 [Acidimicrobiales bacterium]|nr:hypothetical protein [Acidimicrobiales bacterium]
MLALRFYDSQRVETSPRLDLAVVSLLTLTEMVDRIDQLDQELEVERAATKRLVHEMRQAAVPAAPEGPSPPRPAAGGYGY